MPKSMFGVWVYMSCTFSLNFQACILYEMCTLNLFVVTKRCLGEDASKADFDPQVLVKDFPQVHYRLNEMKFHKELSDIKSIVAKMFQVDAMKRPSMEVLMREEFFQDYLVIMIFKA